MKRLPLFLLCGLAAFFLTGCFDIETVVKVKPDGSGTVEQTVLMSKAMVDQMKEMQAQFKGVLDAGGAGGAPAKDEPFSLLNEPELKKQAAGMGEGVTFQSARKVSTDASEGFKAIYAFKDINQLKLDQNPASAAPKMGPMTAQANKQEVVSFQLKPGKPAELTVTMPPHKLDASTKPDKDAAPASDEKPDPGTMAMMQQMFKGLRMALAVEVEGTIASTDASYRNGSRVTLMELDFGKLTADPKAMEKLAAKKPESVEDAKKLLKDIPGIKAETNEKISIKFQ